MQVTCIVYMTKIGPKARKLIACALKPRPHESIMDAWIAVLWLSASISIWPLSTATYFACVPGALRRRQVHRRMKKAQHTKQARQGSNT
jgi:hypothetical protein